ncbi:SusD/RagB family nutrient-binding outer membrane lipoprotein [Bizionia gelidisalsuginis]|uniref:SusD/RagB family nutrient-binding outer membrane lipoprotein n=2 Tax=Bizionia TaxID=283785 RepID=A0A8H2LCR1_9FLAO|nr:MULTISPECIES: SusD/RagB family nutrient-binding outer membrane lipoprotein [Bizionia]TYB73881.1 SusD/RagB family nutrient-binding outer membrane lipoprotein [Bizionia saleffrena]TYC12844.1 SusD/RagB family nutrient-binding outer membrane lipoprotein [Bizionia gelidisalsuginis]
MKKYFNKGFILLALGVSTLACESTLDINETEVGFTTENVTPDLLLAGAIQAPRYRFEVTGSETGSIFMNQWAGDINNVTGGFQDEFRLNFTQTYGPGSVIWRDIYAGMGTYQAIINYEGAEYNNHKAISRILKSYYFQFLTDVYGDIPYSEALQFGENFTPAYDDSKSIYRDLITELNTAIGTLNNYSAANPVGVEDTVFAGDANGWIQVANTLKLRILLRQSELAATDSETASYLADQYAALDTNFLTTDATINPGYANADGQLNPFWENYGQDTAGNDTFDNDFIVPSEYQAEFLKGSQTEDGLSTNVPDPRLTRMYEPVTQGPDDGNVTGVQQGATNTTAPPELSELGPGFLKGPDQDSFLFTAAESFFLQAEAAERLYISGNAQQLFNSGIQASFDILGAGSAATYITASGNTNRIGYAGSTNKIEAIMTQKWIALTGINAMESFIDYNRTGFPSVPLPIIAEQSKLPYRLLYPASESSSNSANVPNQPGSAAFNDRLFWDVN